ncbi:hypothetical protein [Nocardiopsis sp. LOL_012]|uniref:hypothetical protein n=1 Tax=Nocardiopsis sp. LOL_012 TaxID=3345409 RepID=UPI003A8BF9C8
MNTHDSYQQCVRGPRCAEATVNPDTGERTGSLTFRPYCDPCTAHIKAKVQDLPVVYRELRAQYGIQPTLGSEDVRVHTSRVDPSIPIREDLDVLVTEIETTVASYEDRVRQQLGMGQAPPSSWKRRADRVERACRLLAERVTVLLSLPLEWMRIDGAHDERGGVDAGLDLLDLHHRADRAGGSQPVRYVVPVVCPQCRLPAGVTRVAGEDGATCLCGYVIGEDEYRQLTATLAEVAEAAR